MKPAELAQLAAFIVGMGLIFAPGVGGYERFWGVLLVGGALVFAMRDGRREREEIEHDLANHGSRRRDASDR